MTENQYGFPTEVLSLPSQGLLYPEDSALRSGTIDVKYMTAKEEDILTSTNLIKQGVVIDKLLESVIADPKIKLNDMLVGDKNALMVGTRVLGYGKEYKITLTDPDTSERVEHSVDLTTLQHKDIVDKTIYENGNSFSYTTPNTKTTIEFKLLTHADEKNIAEDLKGYKKVEELTGVSNVLTTRLRHQIVSVDGEKDPKAIDNFINNQFLALDTVGYRNYYDEIMPDIELKFDYTSQTGNLHTLDVPLGIEFFWPAAI